MDLTIMFSSIESNGAFWQTRNTESVSFPEEGLAGLAGFEDSSFWFHQRNIIITTLAKKYCTGRVFADVGGGNGFVSRGLMNAGFQPILIEPGADGCAKAKQRGIEHVICGVLEQTGCGDDSLENAGAFDVIEHIENDLAFCKEIYRVLKPGGTFLVAVPAYRILWSSEDIQAGHFRRYTVKRMKSVLKNAGFHIEYSSYFFSMLIIPILLLRSIPSFFGLWYRYKQVEEHSEEHKKKTGIVGKLLEKSFIRESKRIAKGKKIFAGSSLVIVCKKPVVTYQSSV